MPRWPLLNEERAMTMTTRTRLLASALLVGVATIPAAAQMRDAPGRFSMQPVDGGFLRLDTQTGAVAMCRPGAGGAVVCQPSDGEQTLAAEVARLRAENVALRAEVKRLQDVAGINPPVGPPVGPPAEKFQLPSEQDVDQALDYVERMYKKFRDRLRNLESESRKPGTPL
jgi:hypothetical protein